MGSDRASLFFRGNVSLKTDSKDKRYGQTSKAIWNFRIDGMFSKSSAYQVRTSSLTQLSLLPYKFFLLGQVEVACGTSNAIDSHVTQEVLGETNMML